MYKVSKDLNVYNMSADNKPVLFVESGSQVEFETWDALYGQLTSADWGFDRLDWNRINPATGPVHVIGAEPGDILSVRIDAIEVEDMGIVLCGRGMGVMGNALQGSSTKIVAVQDGAVHFSEHIKIPLNKMIGVIGVAPQEGSIPCGVPDLHGGNMDCKEIKEGATVLLPVNVSGALLAIGDLHAAMADGEVGVTGVEVGGKVTVTVNVIKNRRLPLPMVSNKDHIMTLASDVDLDKAVDTAVMNMVGYLSKFEGFSVEDAVMLTSLAADVRICQVVDPKKTVRVEFPRKYLTAGMFV